MKRGNEESVIGDTFMAVRRRHDANANAPSTLNYQFRLVFGAAIGLATGLSVFLVTSGIFLKTVAIAFNWNRADVALLPMLAIIGSAVGAPCAGYVADRLGWGKVIASSIVMVGVGLFGMALAVPSKAYILSVGLIVGLLGVATTPAGYLAVVSRAFDRRLGTALSLALLGSGVGAAAFPVIAAKLLELVGWRLAYACLAVSCLALGAVAHRLIFRMAANERLEFHDSSRTRCTDVNGNVRAAEGLSFYEAIGDYRFWLIGGIGFLAIFATMGAAIHLASYATDRGFSPMSAAQASGLVGLGLVVARLGVGVLLDAVFAPVVAFGMFVLGATGFCLLWTDVGRSVWLLYTGAMLLGAMNGAEGDLIPYMTRKYFGTSAFGVIYGALLGMSILGGALGIYVFGRAFDLLGTYVPTLKAGAVLCAICALAVVALGRYRYPAQSPPPRADEAVERAG